MTGAPSSRYVRPGPPSLSPGRAPAGVVIRVYTVPDGRLVLEQSIDGTADDEAVAAAARRAGELVEAIGAGSVCLVAYDGDSGDRFPEGAWAAP